MNAFSRFLPFPGPVRACLWMVTAGGLFVFMMAIARHAAGELHMLVVVFWRAAFGVLFMMPWLIRRGPGAMATGQFPAHLARSVASYGGLLCLFWATTMMPLADITAIAFTRPIVASLLAIAVLREASLGRRWAAVALGLSGALIVVRPGFEEVNAGVFVVLGAVVSGSVAAIFARFLVRTDHPDTLAMYMVLILTPVSLVPALFQWSWPSLELLPLLALLGLLGTLSQRALARAYLAAEATVVVSFDFLRLPVAALVGYAFFSEVPGVWVWVGGAVIVSASVFVARREAVAAGAAG